MTIPELKAEIARLEETLDTCNPLAICSIKRELAELRDDLEVMKTYYL